MRMSVKKKKRSLLEHDFLLSETYQLRPQRLLFLDDLLVTCREKNALGMRLETYMRLAVSYENFARDENIFDEKFRQIRYKKFSNPRWKLIPKISRGFIPRKFLPFIPSFSLKFLYVLKTPSNSENKIHTHFLWKNL